MQRTIIVGGGGGSNTYPALPASPTVYYSPLGGEGPVGGASTSVAAGSGAYGPMHFACVLSKLYLAVGKISAQAGAIQSQINVGGTTPTAGNLNVSSGAPALNALDKYYYDATDFDSITADQQIGFMETVSGTVGASVLAGSRGVTCDSLNQSVFNSALFSTNQAIFNSSPRYSGIIGAPGLNASISGGQNYAPTAFVAAGLNWQTAAGNLTTSTDTKCSFAMSATQGGTLTEPGLAATIASAGFVGQMYDQTDIAAVPAADYYCLHWTGTNLSGNTLKVGNAGVNMQAAGCNSSFMSSWSNTATPSWGGGNPTYSCFNQGSRFDDVWFESATVVPNSGVFSNLNVQIGTNAYGSTVDYTVLNGPSTGDTGAGSGTMPGSGATSLPPGGAQVGFNATSLATSVAAGVTGWVRDATDIAAFVGGVNQLLLHTYGTGGETGNPTGAPEILSTVISFTAPAHLGLLTQGAG